MKDFPKLTPVLQTKPPKYPTREEVLRRPSLLLRAPVRWGKNPLVLSALLLTVTTGLAGCTAAESAGPGPASAVSTAESVSPPSAASVTPSPDSSAASERSAPSPDALAALTVPVFEHGRGRGSYGCVSVAPPVFLSEEEALQVIEEECAAQGISFSGEKTISGTFPATSLSPMQDGPETADYDGELKLDGYSADLGLGVEFVSREDIVDWQKENDLMATVEEYPLLDTAQRLSAAAPGVAVFYDPASQDYDAFQFDWSDETADYAACEAEYIAAQKEQVTEDLRAQVRDFLQWLAAQGVI